MNIPNDLRYSEDHEWIRVDGKTATVGVTDHAQSELGDVVYVDYTITSGSIAKGGTFGSIEAVKTVADLYAPLSGNVEAVNSDINNAPDSVNSDPYGDGWLMRMEITNPSEIEDLMTADAYKQFIGA